jgi:DNA-binding NtrC family response regulator
MGGEIMAKSRFGEGSTFTILLPIFDAIVSESEETEQEALPRGTGRVLMVDDETAIIQSMQILLESLGYKVRPFTRSAPALKEFKAHPDNFDLVITDYTMPKITGDSLAREIRKVRPHIPIILCSGYLAAKDGLEELHPIEFLGKPVTANQLAHAVRHAMDRAEVLKQSPTIPPL